MEVPIELLEHLLPNQSEVAEANVRSPMDQLKRTETAANRLVAVCHFTQHWRFLNAW